MTSPKSSCRAEAKDAHSAFDLINGHLDQIEEVMEQLRVLIRGTGKERDDD